MLGRAISRAWRAMITVISFGFFKFAEPIENSPQMIELELNDIIAEETAKVGRIKNALGDLRGRILGIQAEAKRVKTTLEELDIEKAGFFAMMDERKNLLKSKGKTDDEVLIDSEFVSFLADYNDHDSSIAAMTAHFNTLVAQEAQWSQMYEDKLLETQQIRTYVKELEAKKNISLVTLELNKSLDEVNSVFAGIGGNKNADRIARIDKLVLNSQGRMETSARMAGTDSKVRSLKARAAAQKSIQNKDLMAKLGLKTAASQVTEAPAAAAPVSEAAKPETTAPEVSS